VQKSKIWKACVIIITYDENGDHSDHVASRVRSDGWGVGVRVPTIIISPFNQHGGVDHTEYETVSILKVIEQRFNLAPLSTPIKVRRLTASPTRWVVAASTRQRVRQAAIL
jgi:phospholipase C